VAVTTNTWLGATTGQLPKAQSVNALLGVHATQNLYAGVQQASSTTLTSTATGGQGTYIAQSFTTGASQTAIGYVIVPFNTATASGANLAATTLSIYASSAGAPAGSPLVSAAVTAEYGFNASSGGGGGSTAFVIYPTPVAGLAPSTTYWIVAAPAGNSSNHFHWWQTTSTSGASTSTNGTSWTAQTYGLGYQVFDQTAVGQLTAVWEDAGARWQALYYATTGELSSLGEYTVAQAGGYLQSYRSLAYSNGLLQKVS
jgi:hypothetical protein